MKTKQNIIALVTGIAIGISTAGPMAQATESWLKATPSTQKFYVDGRKVDLEAYEIGGYNYILHFQSSDLSYSVLTSPQSVAPQGSNFLTCPGSYCCELFYKGKK